MFGGMFSIPPDRWNQKLLTHTNSRATYVPKFGNIAHYAYGWNGQIGRRDNSGFQNVSRSPFVLVRFLLIELACKQTATFSPMGYLGILHILEPD